MKFKKTKLVELDPQEQRLNIISELTRGLGRSEFNNLMDAVKSVFEARQKLKRVKTDDEKENEEIDQAEVILMEEYKDEQDKQG